MSATLDEPTAPESIEASVTYLADDENLAVYIASVGGGEVIPHEGNYVSRVVTIHDGRKRAGDFSLDREGFELVAQTSAVSDFYDDDAIDGVYADEVKALVLEHTGAGRVEIFDHTRRSDSDDLRKQRVIREPAATVHNDYTVDSGPRRLRDHFGDAPEEAEALLGRRFAIVNVWRSINGTVRRSPMTLCDAGSAVPEDLVPVKRQARDRIGEIQMVLHNPAHRWYYFPEMTMDEALLIKTYDSATDVAARFTPHTAFDIPGTAHDAPPRESIETRCFVFF
jgi:hypothetical protein